MDIGLLEFDNQYPGKKSMETILDSIDFHGATQVFLWGIPIASFANLQYYHDDIFKVRQGELVRYTDREQKRGVLTANATTPYIMAAVDLTKTGPFVIDLPAGAIAGMVNDFWQRPITDLGLPGPDKGKGAKWKLALGLEPTQRMKYYDQLDERAECVEKWSWDSKTDSFKSDWTASLPLQWALHPVSEASNTVTLTPVENGVYSLVHVDWETGKEVGKVILGDSPIFNTAGGFFIPLNEDDIYVTGVFGPVRIS